MQKERLLGKILAVTFLASIFLFSGTALAETATSSLPEVEANTSTAISTTSNIEETLNVIPDSSGRELIAEPTIRVGLYKTNEPVKFVSDFAYEIWSRDSSRGIIPAGETTTLSYKNGLYSVKSPSVEFSSSDYFRLVPSDSSGFFTLASYQRLVAGRKKINFNTYRGILEYRYSPKSKQAYIINELPLDLYVAGVAETPNSDPLEYIKALLVAARSYAYALTSKLPPTEKRMFDVYATTVDQIYLGYNSELFMPRVAQAAADTAGEMVTYKNNPVITPYFSHSNGATRNWKSTDRPWLKSVKAVYDKGKKMLGHGMGMSNHDAQQRAKKDGWTYDQILQYYYTSTTVEKIY